MKISQPLVLLLGGVLSASGAGCSAISAVVGEHRAAGKDDQASVERMVSIARVFENQGRYDQAEVMYRKALRRNPADQEIKDQLQQLADRRNGVYSEQNSVASAIARADRVSAPGGAIRRRNPDVSRELRPVPEPALARVVSKSETKDVQLTSGSGATGAVRHLVTPALESLSIRAAERVPLLKPDHVTAEQILAVIDDPESHVSLLLRGLTKGDSVETQCLAATLLGDCDPENSDVRRALQATRSSASNPQLLLAVADSQIQRGEADSGTADCLISLLQNGPSDIRIQATSDLRHFAGTESEQACVSALSGLLDSDSAALRAIGAVTLGDFASLGAATTSKLEQISDNDQNSTVREAARAALSRTTGLET